MHISNFELDPTILTIYLSEILHLVITIEGFEFTCCTLILEVRNLPVNCSYPEIIVGGILILGKDWQRKKSKILWNDIFPELYPVK